MVEVYSPGGGLGGHTIVDENNVEYAQRSKLKLINATVEDDSANDQTLVTVTGSGGIVLADVSGASVSSADGTAAAVIKWSDPEDIEIDGIPLATWSGTLVVRKVGSAPTNRTDGTVVVNNKTRNQYASAGFTDSGLSYGTTYYYRFFPYTTGNAYTDGSSINVTPDRIIISSLPTVSGSLTYNANEQTQSFTGYDPNKMTVSDNKGTNAGDYTASFTPLANCKWWDGSLTAKTVNWSIAKANGTATLSASPVTLDSDHLSASVTISNETGAITDVTSSDTDIATVLLSDHTITINSVNETSGSTTINVSIAASANYNAATITISVTASFALIYGFHQDFENLDTDTTITYLAGTKNANFAPMVTNEDTTRGIGTGVVTSGSWGSFLTDVLCNKPAMVNNDGTLDYWLDPTDYTKKLDGTPSDISNQNYSGAGAFAWINKMYMKEVYGVDGNSRDVYFAFGDKPDNSYHAVGFIDDNRDELEGLWIPMFSLNSINEKTLGGLGREASGSTLANEKNKIDSVGTRARFFGGPISNVLRDLFYMLYKNTHIRKVAGWGYSGTNEIVKCGDVPGFKGAGYHSGYNAYNTNTPCIMLHSSILGNTYSYLRDPYVLLDYNETNGSYIKYSDNYEYDITGENYKTEVVESWKYDYRSTSKQDKRLCKISDSFGSIPSHEGGASQYGGIAIESEINNNNGTYILCIALTGYYKLYFQPGYSYGDRFTAAVLLIPPSGYTPIG